ncbi:MAG TPA: peptidoglycan recognition family protein [Rhizomicrobium sp.]|nr:peptidoglycan recognition family protein [Rhizomicrobium sp.]
MVKLPRIPQAWKDQSAGTPQEIIRARPDLNAMPEGILGGWQPSGWSLEGSGPGFLLDPETIAQIDFGGPARGNVAGTAAPGLDAVALQSIDRAPAPMMAARAAKSHETDSQVEEVTATAYRLKRDVAGNPMPDLPNMVARDKWARYAPEDGKLERQDPSAVREIVLHHTGNPSTAQDVEAIHRHHDGLTAYARDAGALLGITDSYKKNGDVGYHYLIAPDGTIYEGRSIYYQGAHAKHHNKNTIGIAFIGNYQDRPLPQAAMDSLAALTGSLEAATGNRLYHSTHGLYDARKDGELGGAFGQIDSLVGPKPMNR